MSALSFKEHKKQVKSSNYFHRPNNFGVEGKDHINISIHSNAYLGRLLDPSYLKTINYRHIGKFSSVLSLWYWVRSKNLDDALRKLHGVKLKKYLEDNPSISSYVPNFKAIVGVATWIKVKQYPAMLKEIKELDSSIKLLSYSLVKSSELRVCTNYANVIIDIGNEIISAVKEDRVPNFDHFVDNPSLAGLNYLEGILKSVLPSEKLESLKQLDQDPEGEEEEEDESCLVA